MSENTLDPNVLNYEQMTPAERKLAAEMERDLRNAVAFGKALDQIFAPLKFKEPEKNQRGETIEDELARDL
jgi:sigma54-dependent transcription regulator